MEIADVLQFLNLCLAAVVAGGMIVVAAAIIPARARLPVGSAVALHQITTQRIDRFMPPAAILSGATAAVLLALAEADAALIIGIAATAAVGAISAALNIPVNRRIATWVPDAPPPDHGAVFRRWNSVHRARTVIAMVALAAYIIAALP
jgi:hypothetical protein